MDEAEDIISTDSTEEYYEKLIKAMRTDSCSESHRSESSFVSQGKRVNQELIEASESGDHEGVSRALEKRADITSRDLDGDTGLHLGAMHGHDIVVKTLLEAGIDVNLRDSADSKWTPLINAAYWDKISCLEILLDYKANPDLKDEEAGQTALMHAAKRNYPDIAAVLLSRGADYKIIDNAGQTAVQLAQKENHGDVVKLLETWSLGDNDALNQEMLVAAREGRGRLVSGLIRVGADVEATDEEGRTGVSLLNTSLITAATKGLTKNVQIFLCAGADPEIIDEKGETGLDIAVRKGDRATTEAFLDHGTIGYNREKCLEQCDKNRELIQKLISAAGSGDNQAVEAALVEGAEITSTDCTLEGMEGDTGLHYSARDGHQSVLLTLLNRGLDENIRGRFQKTALMCAAEWGNLTCLQTLLDNGALLDLEDESGITALMYAAKRNYPDITTELLVRGADKKIVNNDEKNALQIAKEEDNEDVVRLLEAWGDQEKLDQEMMRAVSKGGGRLVNGLLRAGAKDKEGRTIPSLMNTGLMIATNEGSAVNVKIFIRSGANVETRDESGETCLDMAVRKGYRDVAEAFFDHGISGYDREKCLELCEKKRKGIDDINYRLIYSVKIGDYQAVEKALDEGAEITFTDGVLENNERMVDKRYGTGLHHSADNGHQSVLLTLLNRGLNVNIRDNFRRTALMRAVENGNLACTQTLLDHGALLDLRTGGGKTALMFAAENDHPDIVGELLGKNADDKIIMTNSFLNDEKTALQLAEDKNHQDVVGILKARNNKGYLNHLLLEAAKEGKWRLIHGLIASGADVEVRDQFDTDHISMNGLHLGAKKGHESVVRLFLKRGIYVNTRADQDWTPLMFAAKSGHHRIVKVLIDHGADPYFKNERGFSAATIAADSGHTKILCDMLETRADGYNERALEITEKINFNKFFKSPGRPGYNKPLIDIILDRGPILIEDQSDGARALVAATEVGCPIVVSDLLARGANIETRNDMGETLFHVAARLPKTRKDQFEEYLKEVDRKREIEPTETTEDIVKEAEIRSRNLAMVFMAQSLSNHDPAIISQYLLDVVNFVNMGHFDSNVFGNEQNFYLKYDKAQGKETLLQSIVNKGLVKEREEVIYVLKKVDLERYPNEQEDADYRLKKQVKKACPPSVGLRDCIQSIDEKFPWSHLKHKFMSFLSFFIFILGTIFYGLDIYTDIRFSQDMFNNSKRNFTQEISVCRADFEREFSSTINVCRDHFTMTTCLNSLAVVKKIAVDCFENGKRFSDPKDWWIAGTVSVSHCALPILIGITIWGVFQIGQDCNLKSLMNIPLPFVTRWFKFRLEGELYRNYAWSDRNKSQESQSEYESKVSECMENLDVQDQIVNLSLIIESSVEASFQFFFQTVYVLPTLILSFTDVSGTFDWKDLFNWKTFSIVLSFATFAWAFNVIR